MSRLRLRTQIVALVSALLALTFLLVAAITTIALHRFLVERLDEQLQTAGGRFANSVGPNDDHDADNRGSQLGAIAGQSENTLEARVVGGRITDVHIVGHDPDDATIQPGSAALATLARLAPQRNPHTVHLPGLGSYRLMVSRSADGDLLVTGLPMHPVDETIARLITIEAVVFGAALVIVAISAGVSIRLALRPLERVADTAGRVADLPLSSGTVELDARAPDTNEHTEVGMLSGAFNHMLEHVEASLHHREASEERLRRFVADASHELRTPVAVIRGHAELARRTSGTMPDQVAHSLDRIDAESKRMGRLVDDLLTLARLDSGRRLANDEVDLSRLALDTVSDARAAGPEHRWQLDLPEEPVEVVGDEHALHQVLANLLANARTHTPAGTTVCVELDDAQPGAVTLIVSDDGPGIAPDAQATIFERFVRADDNRSATTGGSGLGLAIVDAIVRAHNGTITVESVPGSTRFVITLPAKPTAG